MDSRGEQVGVIVVPWLCAHVLYLRRYFGKEGSQYDFKNVDIAQLQAKKKELEEQQKGMKKKVNAKAPHTLERYASGFCFLVESNHD